MTHFALHDSFHQCEAFPYAPLHANEMVYEDIEHDEHDEHEPCQESAQPDQELVQSRQKIAQTLLSINTRPFPERIDALIKCSFKTFTRQKFDAAFADCENISMLNFSMSHLSTNCLSTNHLSTNHLSTNHLSTNHFSSTNHLSSNHFSSTNHLYTNPDFDCGCKRLTESEALSILNEYPANRVWIQDCLYRFSSAYGLPLKGDIIHDARILLNFLYKDISTWEADSFPLDCMAYLKNRYGWTFRSNAWSLREQLRQEAVIIIKSWNTLFKMAKEQPLLFIINERAPNDYFTSFLPKGAALFSKTNSNNDSPVLIYQGVKISSSEYRVALNETLEGEKLNSAMKLAQRLDRRPVLCDFSRRRFPRSFLRVAGFALENNFGIFPMGKLFDHAADRIPEAKSASGFPVIKGNCTLTLTLFDPWPVSDPEITKRLSEQDKKNFCHVPLTKPWQDDRIGARVEMELDENGIYKVASKPWVVPVMGRGWMRVDTLFKSRLGRFLVRKNLNLGRMAIALR